MCEGYTILSQSHPFMSISLATSGRA
uniref:Uncharacterized protein n=1 Tax=Arundo donax TaxID=35708 RepID=A0A0A9GVG1_ARUDO